MVPRPESPDAHLNPSVSASFLLLHTFLVREKV